MASTPTITSATPASPILAGGAGVVVTLVGTQFATGLTITSGNAGVTASSPTYVSATGATVVLKAAVTARGEIPLTLTNTDTGTVTTTVMTVKGTPGTSPVVTVPSPLVDNQGTSLPVNPVAATAAGTAVAGRISDAQVVSSGAQSATTQAKTMPIGSVTETTHQKLNPAWEPVEEASNEGGQQGQDASFPGVVTPRGAEDQLDLTPVGAQANTRDLETVPVDHSPQLPLAPAAPTATSPTAGHATVNWTAPAANADPGYAITGYVITLASSDGGTVPAPVTVGNVLTTSIAGLTSLKHYTFTVAAINAAGTGPASAASASLAIT